LVQRKFRVEITPDPNLDPIKLALLEAAGKEEYGDYAELPDGILGRVHDFYLAVCAQRIQLNVREEVRITTTSSVPSLPD